MLAHTGTAGWEKKGVQLDLQQLWRTKHGKKEKKVNLTEREVTFSFAEKEGLGRKDWFQRKPVRKGTLSLYWGMRSRIRSPAT